MGLDISTLPKDHPLRRKIEQATGEIKTTTRNDNPEHRLQVEAVNVFQIAFAKHKRRLWAIPNGGARDKLTAGSLKAEGVLAGVWDLLLAVPVGEYGGCFIETKVPGRKLSTSQKAFRYDHEKDYDFFVYRSVSEFVTGIQNYLEQKPNQALYD